MLVSTDTASSKKTVAEADEAAVLEGLADAGDALTAALVAHSLDGIVLATRDAGALVGRLELLEADPAAQRLDRDRVGAIADRIGATARRNALLLETAWATDAEILRLLAAAVMDQEPGTAAYGAPAAGSAPVGWLDRSA